MASSARATTSPSMRWPAAVSLAGLGVAGGAGATSLPAGAGVRWQAAQAMQIDSSRIAMWRRNMQGLRRLGGTLAPACSAGQPDGVAAAGHLLRPATKPPL